MALGGASSRPLVPLLSCEGASVTPGCSPPRLDQAAQLARRREGNVGRQHQRLAGAARAGIGDAAADRRRSAPRRPAPARRSRRGLAPALPRVASGVTTTTPSMLSTPARAASTSSSMVSTSRCRAASGSTGDSRRLARPSAFTGTIAHVRHAAHDAALACPARRLPREPAAEGQALARQRHLVVERAHHGVGHDSGQRPCLSPASRPALSMTKPSISPS